MSMNKYQAYQNNSVNTATGGELTLMLYNGCIKFMKQSLKDLEKEDYNSKNTNIQKAQNIVQELMLTLDQNVEISKQMLPLYEFALTQLRDGNIKNDSNMVESALDIMTEFRDTWKQVLLIDRKQKHGQKQGATI